MRHFAMTGIETAAMIFSIISGSDIRATPPSRRMSAGTRSRAITATAPASSAIRAWVCVGDVHDDAALEHLGQSGLQSQVPVLLSFMSFPLASAFSDRQLRRIGIASARESADSAGRSDRRSRINSPRTAMPSRDVAPGRLLRRQVATCCGPSSTDVEQLAAAEQHSALACGQEQLVAVQAFRQSHPDE